MTTPEMEYDEACRAGDLAAHVARLSLQELRALHGYAVARMRENETKGGVPALVKWACIIEAAKRTFEP
jgi:hypothetical protein